MNCSTKSVIRTDLREQIFSKELICFSRSSERSDLAEQVFWENWSDSGGFLRELIWFRRLSERTDLIQEAFWENWSDSVGLLAEPIWFRMSSERTHLYRQFYLKNPIFSDRPSERTDICQQLFSEQLNWINSSGPQTDRYLRGSNIPGCPILGNTEDL